MRAGIPYPRPISSLWRTLCGVSTSQCAPSLIVSTQLSGERGPSPLRVGPRPEPGSTHSGEVKALTTDSPAPPATDDAQATAPATFSGVRMTREWAGEAWDPVRDVYSRKVRLDAWDRLESRHYENKKKITPPYQSLVYMLSGDRGSGKTAMATLWAAKLYEQGMDVFSSASLLFGYRIDPVDVFTFAESLPDNCFVFLDEVHGLADRYAEHSTRQRTLSNSLALLRKKGIRLVMASVHEGRVAFSLTGHVQSLFYPRQYRPKFKKKQRRFPKWCYMRYSILGPNPFEGKRMADEWDIPRTGGKCRRVDRPPIAARKIWEAAKLMDTWEKPSIAQGITTTAADVHKRLTEGVGQTDGQAQYEQDREDFFDLLRFVATAINAQDLEDAKSYHWKRLLNVARACGWRGEDKRGRELLRDHLGLNSQYQAKKEALFRYFKPQEASNPE